MKEIIGVCPIDENLKFLSKLLDEFKSKYTYNFKTFELLNNYSSHEICLNELYRAPDNSLIWFFCHGRTNALLGCSFKENKPERTNGRFVYEEKYGSFIGEHNGSKIFKNKKVFCLACNSNGIGKIAFKHGVRTFLGFDEINFDRKEFLLENREDKNVVDKVKFSLRNSVYYSLSKAIDNNLSFHELASYLKICLTKTSNNYILIAKGEKKFPYHLRAAECLLEISDGIKVWGDGNLRMMD